MLAGPFQEAPGSGCPVTRWTSPNGTKAHTIPAPVGACPVGNVPHGGNALVKNILTSSVSQVGAQPIEPLPGPYQAKYMHVLPAQGGLR